MLKIKFALIVLAIAVPLLGAVCLYGYNEIKSLTAEKAQLELTLTQTNIILAAEQVRSSKVEEAAARLEETDRANRQAFSQFERRITALGRSDEKTQSLLDTVVPAGLLRGLRSFPGAGDESGAHTSVSAYAD